MSPAPPAPASSLDFTTLAVRDLTRSFGRRRALHKVSFTASAGELVGVLGPNGAGKSTLLGVLSTLLTPSSGTVQYGDHTTAAGAPLRGRIGVLGHDLFLYPELTARENLAFFARLHGVEYPDAAVEASLEHAALLARADDPVSTFSRGMRQRVALERALIHHPRLVLLDEPFTGLDDASATTLLARLRALRAHGAIVVVATHDLDLAEGLFDHVVFARDGRVVDIVTRPQGLRAAYVDRLGR